MKKYPFSNKAMKAILAASIAFTPVVTTGVLFDAQQVEAATNDEIDNLAKRFFIFYKNTNISTPTAKINAISFEDIKAIVPSINLNTVDKETAFTQLIKNTATLIYSNHSSSYTQLANAVKDFREDNATNFNTIFDSNGDVYVEDLISFVKDMEGNLELAVITADSPTYSDVISNAVSMTFRENGTKYDNLKGKLSSIGLTVEKLFLLQNELNNTKIDTDKNLRSEMMQSAFTEKGAVISSTGNRFSLKIPVAPIGMIELDSSIQWETSDHSKATFTGNTLNAKSNGTVEVYAMLDGIKLATKTGVAVTVTSPGTPGGGNGGTPTTPTTPTTPPAQGEVTMPEPEVVKETNPSGQVEVITKVPAEKVAEIISQITAEKSVIPVKLEKAATGEEVKAQVPAALFAEAMKKNEAAVVAIQTEEATYKLPAAEIKVADLAKKLGVKESDVQITVSVNVVEQEEVQDSVEKNNLKPVSKVIEFTVEAVSGDKKESVKTFSVYVDREIVGDQEFNADNSVAIKFNDDGSFSSIPTLFDGNKATVRSLTNSKYTIVENDVTFSDVDQKNWAEEYIETLASKYIIKGKENGTYAPSEYMSRAQFTILLVRALGLPEQQYDGRFTDVEGNEWFNQNGELMAAVNYGIIKGKEDGRFAPNDKITRAQAAVMIERAMNIDFIQFDESKLDTKKKLADFKDSNKVGDWAKDSIEFVYQAGIVSGKEDATFDPNGNTKRDQMAKILAEFLVSVELMNDLSK